VQHVTEVVNGSTLLAVREIFEKEFDRNFAAWCSGGLTLWNLAEKVVTLASTVAFCEVGRGTQAVRKALPVLLGQIFRPLHNFQVGTELHARDGRSDRVGPGGG